MNITKDKLIVFGVIASALAGLATLLTYLESRKSRVTQSEIAELDKQIKSLQLEKLKA